MQAYFDGTGALRFDWKGCQNHPTVEVACGRCQGCRRDHAVSWALRMCGEMRMHSQNCFITLTYNDEHLPKNKSLSVRDWQLFHKRARSKIKKPFKFYHAGEYGEEDWRPHDHAMIFGYDFPEKEFYKWSPTGHAIYRSPLLEELWSVDSSSLGFSSIQDACFETAAYVARYVLKKRTNPAGALGPGPADFHYKGRKPEYSTMSNGIGRSYYDRYKEELFRHGHLKTPGGHTYPIPRYYRNLMKEDDPARAEGIFLRAESEVTDYERIEKLPRRRRARETCARERARRSKREL